LLSSYDAVTTDLSLEIAAVTSDRKDLQALAEAWSRVAADYESHFIDPYAAQVNNPLWRWLDRIPRCQEKTVADLGCGTGPILPQLAFRFARVIAVDFAPAMLETCPTTLPPVRQRGVSPSRFAESPTTPR
jgi:SAM-dependent methyltransferase